jgi:zinc transporter, ZIP family
MGEALGWGALAASSLVIGAFLGLARQSPKAQIGAVLAFGAGALISAVSFELVEEGQKLADRGWVALGLALGALVYFLADSRVQRHGGGAGPALALGAFLDGIPEQAVLGIGIAAGGGVSIALLGAIFVSNLPEAIGGASEMRAARTSPTQIRRLWIAVAVVCTLACLGGWAIADVSGNNFTGAVNGFAAGALLVMLVDTMIPEASKKLGRPAGLLTTLGFAVATGLSGLS